MTTEARRQSRRSSLELLGEDVSKLRRVYTYASVINQSTLDDEAGN